MKRIVLLMIISFGLLAFCSCKKCRTCQCWKDGKEYEEGNCAYGGGSSNQTQKTWEEYLLEEQGYDYDSVKCITE